MEEWFLVGGTKYTTVAWCTNLMIMDILSHFSDVQNCANGHKRVKHNQYRLRRSIKGVAQLTISFH
jgi:hypothetical protein